jgi:ComF family protein
VWRYEAPLSEVLLAFKLRRLEYLGDALAAAALEALHRRGLLDALAGLDRVVPVPLHWSRRWTRGFNQSEVLARWVAKGLGLPWCDALQRRRGGTAQRLLGRGRRLEAARGAFAIRARERVRDLRVLLVDDVVTTGATLGSAATALRAAGAREVVALAFARTPRPGRESGPVVRTLQG